MRNSSALKVSGTVRLGAPEDFATVHLPGVSGPVCPAAYPNVALEVTCELTLKLVERFLMRADWIWC